MGRIVFGFLLLSSSWMLAQEAPKRSGEEKVRASKALQIVKGFKGDDGALLKETTLIDIGLIDRFPVEEESRFVPVCEVLLIHMLPDKPAEVAVAAGLSLRSILDQNLPSQGDAEGGRAYRVLEREWTAKVLGNPVLRDSARIQRYLVRK
jgi:hypothetical protein